MVNRSDVLPTHTWGLAMEGSQLAAIENEYSK